MAKNKFFYNRVYNVKRNIINGVIIGICVIGIIVCFIITSNFQRKNPSTPESIINIKSEVTVEVNKTFNKDIFFSKIENIDLDSIKISYPNNYDISKTGIYEVTITINDKKYNSTLVVVDTEKPILVVKDVTIYENESYSPNDFVANCTDNSSKECIISYYNDAVDEDGNKINYTSYKTSGTYTVKISAKDESDNQVIKDAKLIINKKSTTTTKPVTPEPEKPQSCKYGNADYDKDKYLVAIPIAANNCAVSLDLYKDATLTEKINKLMETETIRIKKDIEALNLNGRLAMNRQISAVLNTDGNGLVGYELSMIVTITNNNESDTVVSYKVNSDGKRVFTTNPHNLAN